MNTATAIPVEPKPPVSCSDDYIKMVKEICIEEHSDAFWEGAAAYFSVILGQGDHPCLYSPATPEYDAFLFGGWCGPSLLKTLKSHGVAL